jgi:hypothetical protein
MHVYIHTLGTRGGMHNACETEAYIMHAACVYDLCYIHIHIYMYVCICMHTHTHKRTHIHTYLHIHTHTHTQLSMAHGHTSERSVERPFNSSLARKYLAGTIRHIVNSTPRPILHSKSTHAHLHAEGPRSSSVPPVHIHPHAKAHVRDLSPVYGHTNKEVHAVKSYSYITAGTGAINSSSDVFDNTPAAVRPDAAPSRTEALLLKDAYDKMIHNVRVRAGGEDLNVLARQAAARGQPEKVIDIMEPELYVLDVLLSELVKQVKVGCMERGQLLEICRVRFMELFATSAVTLSKMSRFVEDEKVRFAELKDSVAPLEMDSAQAKARISALETEVQALRERNASLERTVKEYERKEIKWNDMTVMNAQAKEQELLDQLRNSDAVNGVLFGKAQVFENQGKQLKAKAEVLQMQVCMLVCKYVCLAKMRLFLADVC